jgi:putative addiction module component (TIGR02574 family)
MPPPGGTDGARCGMIKRSVARVIVFRAMVILDKKAQSFDKGLSMTQDTEQLLTAVLELPDEDRIEITEALIASFQPADQPPFDPAWRDVIRRRWAELRSGKVAPISWQEVKREAREVPSAKCAGQPCDSKLRST